MDFKTMAISATLAGSVLMTGVVFTGTDGLNAIKDKGLDWANKVEQAVQNSKDMASKFNVFKGDVTTQLNEKIAKINSLNSKIADLVSKVNSGSVDLDSANTEIARLNDELQKANDEVKALQDQYNLTDADVQAAYATMQTPTNMDTTMTLDTQAPDTDTTTADATPTGSTSADTGSTGTTTPAATPSTTDKIKSDIIAAYPALTDLTVQQTATTITLSSANIQNNTAASYQPIIESDLGKTVTLVSTGDTYVYSIN